MTLADALHDLQANLLSALSAAQSVALRASPEVGRYTAAREHLAHVATRILDASVAAGHVEGLLLLAVDVHERGGDGARGGLVLIRTGGGGR